jgi:hypothetical protein
VPLYLVYWLRWGSHELFAWASLKPQCSLSDLCLPSSCGYRYEPLHPASVHFLKPKKKIPKLSWQDLGREGMRAWLWLAHPFLGSSFYGEPCRKERHHSQGSLQYFG